MRGGALSNPENLELLRPFVVTSWHGKGEESMDADVREIFRASSVAKDTNVYFFVLDSKAKLLHGFPALPKKRDPAHFKNEMAKVEVSEKKGSGELRLPDGKGVRLFIKSVVEFVPMKPEDWKPLVVPEKDREVSAESLKAWWIHLYPPAIRTVDQSKLFKTVTGTLVLKPAGADKNFRYAVLEGEIKVAKGDEKESAYEGKVRIVVLYRLDAPEVHSIRGVVEGAYLYRQRGEQKIDLTAVLESRPD